MHWSQNAELSGIAADVADRLRGARGNFTVITPAEAHLNQVNNGAKARDMPGATHALETVVRPGTRRGERIAEAHLVDLESRKDIRTRNAAYASADTAALAKALIGTVTLGLKLKPRPPDARDAVNDAAYADYVRGWNLYRDDTRRADDAIVALEKASSLRATTAPRGWIDPKSALPYAAIALAQAQKFRNGDARQWLDRAAETAAKASGISPDSAQVLLASGQIDQLSGRYDQAIAAFTRAAEVDPANQGAWRMLAQTYQSAGKANEAVLTYRKAIAAEPSVYNSYLNFGN